MSEIPSPVVGPVEYRCPTCDVAIEGRHSCAETRIAALEADLASARNLYAARARADALEAQVAELTAHLKYLAAKANIEVSDRNGRAIWLEWEEGDTDGLIEAVDAARTAVE